MRRQHSPHGPPPPQQVIQTETPSGIERNFQVDPDGLPARDGVSEQLAEIEAEQSKADAAQRRSVLLRSLVSLLLVFVGTLTLAVGAGLIWGLGAALFIGGGIAAVIGLLLGLTG